MIASETCHSKLPLHPPNERTSLLHALQGGVSVLTSKGPVGQDGSVKVTFDQIESWWSYSFLLDLIELVVLI